MSDSATSVAKAAAGGFGSGAATLVATFADHAHLTPSDFHAGLAAATVLIVTSIGGFIAHRFGALKQVSSEVEKEWPTIKAAAEAAAPLERVTGLTSVVGDARAAAATAVEAAEGALQKVNEVTSGASGTVLDAVKAELPAQIQTEVARQIQGLLAKGASQAA